MNRSEIPVSWIMAKLASEEKKWEDSKRSISFHKNRIWALNYILDEWTNQCVETEMDRLGMGEN